MKLLTLIPLLVAQAIAGPASECGDCNLAAAGDCKLALDKIPTSGPLNGNVINTWSVGGCAISWIEDGTDAEAADIHAAASGFVNQCCQGPWCSGIVHETPDSIREGQVLQGGCICIYDSSKATPCVCETNSKGC